MKISLRTFLAVAAASAASLLLPACSTVVASVMHDQNERDIKNGRQSTQEYRSRRDEINRELR